MTNRRMTNGPTVTQLRWAATGAITAVGALAMVRGWLPYSVWSFVFCGFCMAVAMPRLSARAALVLRGVLTVAAYLMSGIWRTESATFSVAIVAVCFVPIVIDVLQHPERSKERK